MSDSPIRDTSETTTAPVAAEQPAQRTVQIPARLTPPAGAEYVTEPLTIEDLRVLRDTQQSLPPAPGMVALGRTLAEGREIG